eukprot:scaffold182579_cov20-Tisochrysis_lutea.AAC.4
MPFAEPLTFVVVPQHFMLVRALASTPGALSFVGSLEILKNLVARPRACFRIRCSWSSCSR